MTPDQWEKILEERRRQMAEHMAELAKLPPIPDEMPRIGAYAEDDPDTHLALSSDAPAPEGERLELVDESTGQAYTYSIAQTVKLEGKTYHLLDPLDPADRHRIAVCVMDDEKVYAVTDAGTLYHLGSHSDRSLLPPHWMI